MPKFYFRGSSNVRCQEFPTSSIVPEALVFSDKDDWQKITNSSINFPKSTRVAWEMIRKAVGEELNCVVSAPKKDERKSLLNKAKEKTESASKKRLLSDTGERPVGRRGKKATGPKKQADGSTKVAKKERAKQDPAKPKTKIYKRKADDLANSTGEKGPKSSPMRKKQRQQNGSANNKQSSGTGQGTGGGGRKVVEFDLDKQCGVVVHPSNKQCTRSLTCKAHSMAMKRSVRGRSQPFDSLLQAHLAKSRTAKHARNVDSTNLARRINAKGELNAAGLAGMGLEDSDDDERGSDSEAEQILNLVSQYNPKPLAVKSIVMPRRRQHYLRVHDLFLEAMLPNQKAILQNSLRNGAGKPADLFYGGGSRDRSGNIIGNRLGSLGLNDNGLSLSTPNFMVGQPESLGSIAGLGSGTDVPFTSVATVATVHSNPSMAAMMSTLRMAVGNRSSLNTGLLGPKQ
ncbi:SAGA-associated factor 73 [Smittium culicis]|uniref:SAGA-associated factor 73 n=1 Tax=Smittium culicis TaxID=133412 RepID=A0A1R1WXD5_9FUNG|nr:SAGA-associated factor 73 [Smittium culicis]OMJ11313.1 SAGA-associated factor 73 [Smittium culicis]OMJ19095.1 SAGA-associated factor 73 [Smittium culicis]